MRKKKTKRRTRPIVVGHLEKVSRRVFEVQSASIASCLKRMNFFIYFLRYIVYYVILDFLMANILPSLRSIPQ